jgi:hypothetical protein
MVEGWRGGRAALAGAVDRSCLAVMRWGIACAGGGGSVKG